MINSLGHKEELLAIRAPRWTPRTRHLLPALVVALAISPGYCQLPNFSGTYILVGATGDLRFDPKAPDPPTLKIVQTNDSLQISEIRKARQETNTLPLNGNEVPFTRASGPPGRARVRMKGKKLEIERVLPIRVPMNAPPSEIHDVERWSLSRGGRILKLCGAAEVRGGIVQFTKSGCQIFERQ